MKKTSFTLGLLSIAAMAMLSQHVEAGTTVSRQTFMTGLNRPMWLTHAPGDFDRVFIIEQRGAIRIVKNGSLLPTPFLDIDALVLGGTSGGSEQGMLGLAFHPDYATNGYFYVYYINLSSATVVARYQVSASNADVANAGSGDTILTYSQPFSNHNGGWIAFGPDGYLYIASGDGGSSNDPSENAQNLNTLLGKMLRIDVNGDDFPANPNADYSIPPTNPFVAPPGRDEIWAYGLRNHWRNSFDAATGDLYIADVGQNNIEEVNFQPASSTGGENYGWDCKEGNNCLTNDVGCSCTQPGLTDPIHTYNHSGGNCSVTGGYVYRGCSIPDLQGVYFFADYCSRQVWSFRLVSGVVTEFTTRTAQLNATALSSIASFGVDAYGEMYMCDLFGGAVYKIVSANTGPDCDNNATVDACEILDGSAVDDNNNGIPDSCELSVVSSFPPNGSIDARQPSQPDGSGVTGWVSIDINFSGDASGVTTGDFQLTQIGGMGPAPDPFVIQLLDVDSLRLFLTAPLNPGTRNILTFLPSGDELTISYLPGDVSGDATTSVGDLLVLVDVLNNLITLPAYSTDIDRSGVTNASDVLRAIDLLNGAAAYDVWNGVSLP